MSILFNTTDYSLDLPIHFHLLFNLFIGYEDLHLIFNSPSWVLVSSITNCHSLLSSAFLLYLLIPIHLRSSSKSSNNLSLCLFLILLLPGLQLIIFLGRLSFGIPWPSRLPFIDGEYYFSLFELALQIFQIP